MIQFPISRNHLATGKRLQNRKEITEVSFFVGKTELPETV
jgi:hypothetical protein